MANFLYNTNHVYAVLRLNHARTTILQPIQRDVGHLWLIIAAEKEVDCSGRCTAFKIAVICRRSLAILLYFMLAHFPLNLWLTSFTIRIMCTLE